MVLIGVPAGLGAARSAALLNISRATFFRRAKELGIVGRARGMMGL